MSDSTTHCETYINGDKQWHKDGELHRIDGPAVEHANGDTQWYQFGQLHREDGPAIEWANGDKYWWYHGKRHRTDGPAVISAGYYLGWWVNGVIMTPAKFAATVLDKEAAMLWKMGGYCWPFEFGDNKWR
jgi:hypothetical protein